MSENNTPNPNSSSFCYHCGTENPRDLLWQATLDGQTRSFCCAGCQAIAQSIHAAGLAAFYKTRSSLSAQAQPEVASASEDEWVVYDQESVVADYLVKQADGSWEIALLIEGMTCGACVWLIESWLKKQTGVIAARVNYASRRATLTFRPDAVKLSTLLRALAGIGYRAYPYDPRLRDAQARHEKRTLTFRMGVALCCMMQVMMMAVPNYLGGDIAVFEDTILRWASLVLTLPALFYSAWPFYKGALRDLIIRRPGMDVPITLGVITAFIASVWHTFAGAGPVYYDSVTMFIALLLVARYVELVARQRSGETLEAMARQKPMVAERFDNWGASSATRMVTAMSLAADDYVLIRAGATVPADGEIVEGTSHVEEAMLTGESWAHKRSVGEPLFAGSVNGENALVMRVNASGDGTRLATILRLVDRAASERPRVARLADRVAYWFVAVLLSLAVVVGVAWWIIDPSRTLAIVFSLLVITCPCALSLATPTALSAAAGALGRRRVLLSRSDALETLARVDVMVFDKTGTLSEGAVRLTQVEALDSLRLPELQAIAQALEARSEHPIAKAFRGAGDGGQETGDGGQETGDGGQETVVERITIVAGQGVAGFVDDVEWRIGRAAFVDDKNPEPPAELLNNLNQNDTLVFLGNQREGIVAVFAFADSLRADAGATIAALRAAGVRSLLLSGDRKETVASVAAELGIADAEGGLLPEDKRQRIQNLQEQGHVVAMIGDGINDAPALAQAQISISLGSATALAQWTADVVILSDELPRLVEALTGSRRTLAIIRENLTWAVLYNVVAIPAAAVGLVTPLLAAIGMSLSSLLVVLNALRALKLPEFAGTDPSATSVSELQQKNGSKQWKS